MNQIHFLVGMSRSGTNWLMDQLNSHPKIATFGETSFFGRNDLGKDVYAQEDIEKLLLVYEESIDRGYKKVCKEIGGTYPSLIQTLKELKPRLPLTKTEIFQEITENILEYEEKNIAIEKTPNHLNHLSKIRKCFPDAKLMVTYRDADGFMLSYKHQGDRKESKIKKRFERTYHPLGCLLVYRKYEASLVFAKGLPNTLLIDFQEIQGDQRSTLSKVYRFLEVEEIKTKTANTNSSFSNSRPELSVEDKVWLILFNKRKFSELTVSERSKSFPILLYSFLKLPLWVIYSVHEYSKISSSNVFLYFFSLLRK